MKQYYVYTDTLLVLTKEAQNISHKYVLIS